MINVETRAAIEALVIEFSYLIDHGEAAQVPALFTDNGVFESPMASLSGKAALTAGLEQRARAAHQTRHVVANLRLEAETADRVRGNVLLTLYRWTPGEGSPGPVPAALLEYDDVYVRGAAGDWQFAVRKALPVLPPSAD